MRYFGKQARNFHAKARKLPSASVEVNPLHALEFVALCQLDFRHTFFLELQSLADIANVTDQPAQTVGLQRSGMISPFPSPVQGEVTFDPAST